MGRKSRTKGIRGELEAVHLLRRAYPQARRKVVNHGGVENGVDLEGTGALRVQVKRGKRPAPISRIDEIKDGTGYPVLMTRGDNGRWYAVMEAEDLITILADIGEAYED